MYGEIERYTERSGIEKFRLDTVEQAADVKSTKRWGHYRCPPIVDIEFGTIHFPPFVIYSAAPTLPPSCHFNLCRFFGDSSSIQLIKFQPLFRQDWYAYNLEERFVV